MRPSRPWREHHVSGHSGVCRPLEECRAVSMSQKCWYRVTAGDAAGSVHTVSCRYYVLLGVDRHRTPIPPPSPPRLQCTCTELSVALVGGGWGKRCMGGVCVCVGGGGLKVGWVVGCSVCLGGCIGLSLACRVRRQPMLAVFFVWRQQKAAIQHIHSADTLSCLGEGICSVMARHTFLFFY